MLDPRMRFTLADMKQLLQPKPRARWYDTIRLWLKTVARACW